MKTVIARADISAGTEKTRAYVSSAVAEGSSKGLRGSPGAALRDLESLRRINSTKTKTTAMELTSITGTILRRPETQALP